MTKRTRDIAQLYLRLALGFGFILPVMDRWGMLGAPGKPNVGWGNWNNFTNYTNSLMPYLDWSSAELLGWAATFFELVFGIFLIIGYRTKLAAYGSFLLTLAFALSMFFFAGYRAPFNYSVFSDSAAALLLASIPVYRWSIDHFAQKLKTES